MARAGVGIAGAAWVVALASLATADELTLRNGDVLRGALTRLDAGKVAFAHATGAALEVPLDAVRAFATDGLFLVRLADGTSVRGVLAAGLEERVLRVSSDAPGAALAAEFAFDRLAGLGDPPPPPSPWSGQLSASATVLDGNTRGENYALRFNGQRKSAVDLIEALGGYTYGETFGVMSARNGNARIQYNYNVLPSSYLYVAGALEYDRFKALNMRSRGGGGVGVTWLDRPEIGLRTEAGLEYINEDLRNTPDTRITAARAALTFTLALPGAVKLREFAEIMPNIEKGSDFVARSETTLSFDLGGGFGAGVSVVCVYDEQPPAGVRHRADTTLQATLTYTFG